MQKPDLTPIVYRLATLILCVSVSVHAQEPNRSKKNSRKPASVVSGTYVDKNGIPRLADGSPDYAHFPNPFVVKKWTLEAQGTMGTAPASGEGYQEFALGANAYFYDWMAWRNLAFYRSGKSALYGVDTTTRMSYDIHRKSQFAVFASPGFRLAGGGAAAPILESGLTVQIGGMTVGAGGRTLLRSWTETSASNETQFFVTLSSGGHP